MKIRKIPYFLAFLLFFGTANFAYGAIDDSRYFIKTNAGFWKNTLGVRNEFKDGFTSDLNDFEIRLAKIFRISIVPVPRFYILPGSAANIQVNSEANTETNDTTLGVTIDSSVLENGERILPSNQISWGTRLMYGNVIISKTSGGKDVNVAVIDTGILVNHPDLKNRIFGCMDFTQDKAPVVEGKCNDENGHGTHVAGIIAADGGNDGRGLYGIAPESNIMAYKACDASGLCWADDIAKSLMKAADNNVNIVNISIGGDLNSKLIGEAIDYAVARSVLIIASAGNDGAYEGSIDYPASDARIIGVSAMDASFNVPEWSSRGSNLSTIPYQSQNGDIEFVAPGVNIESTWKNGGYAILSGSSMSAPHISGLAAKLWQFNSGDPSNSTRDILRRFSIDLTPEGDDNASGWGLPIL